MDTKVDRRRARRTENRSTGRWDRALTLLFLLTVVLPGCGDASFFIVFRSGTVASDPSCSGGGGSFDLRETNGLTILIVFESDDAVISAGGSPVGCRGLQNGDTVDVQGNDSGSQIDASRIVVRP